MEKETTVNQSPSESEKGGVGRRPSAGDGHVPNNFREQDFMTRNGLNLKSFQRRKQSSTDLPIRHGLTAFQATGVPMTPSWTAP